MRPETALSRWLADELPRRGYPLGPRAGGIARFAADAGLSPATASRTVNGKQEPSIETLRALGDTLGYTLIEMLEFAGLIEPEERAAHAAKAEHPSNALAKIEQDDWWVITPPDDLWLGIDWPALTRAERWIWHTPGLSRVTRFRLFKAAQFEHEYEIQADAERHGNDRESNPRHGYGTNGA